MFTSAPITSIILLVTIIVSWQAMKRSDIFEKLLHYPYRIKHRKEYYRMFSHMLIHADFIHLAFNMFALYSFGMFMEPVFTRPEVFVMVFPDVMPWSPATGYAYYLVLYVGGGLAATLPSLRKHSDNYGYTSVGASGAVSALLMAFMIMFPTHQLMIMFIPMPAYLGILVFFVAEYLMQRSGKTGIAHDAHIGGALFGIVFVLVTKPQFFARFVEQLRLEFFG
jgi:membrane associated rhomboid family serine protease